MSMIEEAGSGVVLYLSRERPVTRLRDIGGPPAESPADVTSGYLGTEILLDLGLSSIRLLTSEPGDAAAVEGFGLSVTGALDIVPPRC
jgi:GTP cyclohydrolase II